MNRTFSVLWQIAANRLPGFRFCTTCVWSQIGSLKFKVAYRNACRTGDVRLHVGAGSIHLNGWLNTDITPLSQLYLDVKHHLPIKDNTVSHIFAEHFIEHIPRHAALAFFKESLRVLRPGGIMRFTTPDVEALAMAYLNNPEKVRLLNERNRQYGYLYTFYPSDILNKAFMEDSHMCLYDFQTLEQMFVSAGFQDVTRCRVGESKHATLCGIERHNVGSIADEFTCVVEATKPLLSNDL